MSKELRSATAHRDGRIEAVYDRESLGAVTPAAKRSEWPQETMASAKALIAAADGLSKEDPDVVQVQVYGVISGGPTDHAAAGELVDVTFSGNLFQRAGESAPVPSALASARDAFKTAVMAALA